MYLSKPQKRFLYHCAKFKELELEHEAGTCYLKSVVAYALWKKGILERVNFERYKLTKIAKVEAKNVLEQGWEAIVK